LVFKLEDSSEKMAERVKKILTNKVKEESDIISNKITELYKQISNEIKKAFGIRTILYRRLINAFPNFQISKDSIKKSIENVRSKVKTKIRK
jgi:septation ring formation regulator EzrA